jgi:hypothetical protein
VKLVDLSHLLPSKRARHLDSGIFLPRAALSVRPLVDRRAIFSIVIATAGREGDFWCLLEHRVTLPE